MSSHKTTRESEERPQPALRLLANFVVPSIVPGDMCAGNVFHSSVRTLVDETIPHVREPLGNPAGFQAHEDFSLAVKKHRGFSPSVR
jgi:hypothetical protein